LNEQSPYQVSVSLQSPYQMSISLNVLNHLGLNLYSNVSAVLSEVVANAYDADAEEVSITIDHDNQQVIIVDDGEGMTLADINDRYLNVGYQRRTDKRGVTEKFERPVMGRKGIGKLSLFSVASSVEIQTTKNGQKHALRMTITGIRDAITADPEQPKPYRPERLSPDLVDFQRGTRIILTDLKKGLTNVADGLRKRLARRFSVLGSAHHFRLYIGDREVTVLDRDYFHKLQYLWAFGGPMENSELIVRCAGAEEKDISPPALVAGYSVHGWIGTVKESGSLKEPGGDNINKISLMVRGKLAHEDLLEEISEAKVFRSYLIGELHADFLDMDNRDDIATSSRQRIIEDDPRYQELIEWLGKEITKIGSSWTDLRNSAGTKVALENELIKDWFKTLNGDTRKKAERLFGKINTLTVDDPRQRAELFSHAVLAFETLRYRDNLDALDAMDPREIHAIATVFKGIEELEAALYYQIVSARLRIIEKLEERVDADALEKVLQALLFENLWLLDTSWERATDRSWMEERIGASFTEIKLSEAERLSRIDIRYKRVAGANVIVELKRASVRTSTTQLLEQVDKYRNVLVRYLADAGKNEPVQVVCVVGRDLTDWENPMGKQQSDQILAVKDIRVVKYEQLLTDARAGYGEYLDKRKNDLGHLRRILDSLAIDSADI
jgi:hypothetical protein